MLRNIFLAVSTLLIARDARCHDAIDVCLMTGRVVFCVAVWSRRGFIGGPLSMVPESLESTSVGVESGRGQRSPAA